MFGIPQLILPRESINRFAIALLVWFWLIFRTCYQSMMFEFMTSDMRKPLPATIDDLVKWNYTIVLVNSKFFAANYLIIGDRKDIHYRKKNFWSLYNDSLNGRTKTKYAFLVDFYLHQELNSSFHNTLPIMENVKLTRMTAYMMEYNDMLMPQFNEIIHDLIPTGIPKFLIDYGSWLLKRPFQVEIKDSIRVLSMTDLEFMFVLWLASLSLPISCFLIEISIGYYRKVRRTIEKLEFFTIAKLVEIILEIMMKNFNGRL
ncbi:hypothetical protein PVAND_014537 [Polypedilum vanderplanki]|uniref:Ionotropic receptor n=1 Tax=Polypedilum vanderplanki TaxID=319348 RepID=A0A9J6B9P3_POLVA|nr:hypothetical protein PVAND_014537 [Polypedilum vanderplanki]